MKFENRAAPVPTRQAFIGNVFEMGEACCSFLVEFPKTGSDVMAS